MLGLLWWDKAVWSQSVLCVPLLINVGSLPAVSEHSLVLVLAEGWWAQQMRMGNGTSKFQFLNGSGG